MSLLTPCRFSPIMRLVTLQACSTTCSPRITSPCASGSVLPWVVVRRPAPTLPTCSTVTSLAMSSRCSLISCWYLNMICCLGGWRGGGGPGQGRGLAPGAPRRLRRLHRLLHLQRRALRHPGHHLVGGGVVHVDPGVGGALQPLAADHHLGGGRHAPPGVAQQPRAARRHPAGTEAQHPPGLPLGFS